MGTGHEREPVAGLLIIDELTDLVEQAVLGEFDRISERGGVLGAMETGYQRGRIQDESMLYEHGKHDGSLPLVGVNTFRNPAGPQTVAVELARATEQEKRSQLERVRDFQDRNREVAHDALAALQEAARSGDNVFAVLMERPASAACSRSPRRSSRSAASTDATSNRKRSEHSRAVIAAAPCPAED